MQSPVSRQDVSLYRAVYGVFTLVTLWRVDFVATLPPVAFDPPDGPFVLLHFAHSAPFAWALQVLLCSSLSALVIGWHTRVAAIATGVLLILLYGIGFSYGAVVHNIFMAVVPLLFSFSAWSSCYSVDAHLKRPNLVGHPWAPRCLAVALGVGILTGGLAKVYGGWLSLETQATFGHFVLGQHVFDISPEASQFLQQLDHPALWELLDYATVALECGFILIVLSWRTFYFGLAVLAVFHLFILVIMGIAFPYNLAAYAAFIPWAKILPTAYGSSLDWFTLNLASRIPLRLTVWLLLSTLGVLLAWIRPRWFVPYVEVGVIIFGAIVGSWYLAMFTLRAAAHIRDSSRMQEQLLGRVSRHRR
jgi:hypothetical protein